MTVLIYVLGSDIPRRNRTVLRFFNDAPAATSRHTREFMVTSKNDGLSDSYPTLSIQFFPGKKLLAGAIITKAKANRQQRSFSHGQFNLKLWLVLLSGGIRPSQSFWHIQGANPYELSSGLRHKFFYPLRRLVQKRVDCAFTTHGDLSSFAKMHPKVWGELLYSPTRMDLSLNMTANDRQCGEKMTILVRNSGDRSSEHIAALRAVHQQFGNTVKMVIPMEHPPNGEVYIEEICQARLELLSEENLQVLSEKLGFGTYLTLLRQCDLSYFIFTHQQGTGVLCLLIQAGILCMPNRENPFWQDMTEQHLPVLFATGDLNEDVVREA